MSQPAPPGASTVHAAGALVWREHRGRLEVVLVHRPRYRDWSWPKGKLEAGEPVAAAAVREVAEETGQHVVLGAPLPALRYRIADGSTKVVRYWAARTPAGDDERPLAARATSPRASTREIDDVVWVALSTAAEMLTRPADRRPLDALAALHSRDRLSTSVLVVARHGQAVPRNRWRGTEATRPLTTVGRRQAEAAVSVLAAFGVRTVLTSPWVRCTETVAPYVTRTGVDVQTVETVTEAAHAADPTPVTALVETLVAAPRDAVLATHRPVLPTVLDAVAESTRRWTQGTLPAKDPYLRTGELLVAHVAGRGRKARVVAVEHHRPVRQPAVL